MQKQRRIALATGVLATLILIPTSIASADHAWGGYHWARTTPTFTLALGDSVTSAWDSYLVDASNDWTASTVLNTVIIPGTGGKNCKPSLGRGEVCNSKYGNNGWLGIASVWTSGTHITQATVKMNDTYFIKPQYNTSAWKHLVVCQEIGHIFGLGHQDENFTNANLGTCMDYTNNPTPNQHPNQHDYDQLVLIYSHLDSITTLGTIASAATAAQDSDNPNDWGKEVSRSADGRSSTFEQELGRGQKIIRHVFWAEPRGRAHERDEH